MRRIYFWCHGFFLAYSIFILDCRPTFCQVTNESIGICWSNDKKLKWSDFRFILDSLWTSGKTKAACASRIEHFLSREKNGPPNFQISNIFDKSQSWTSDTTKTLLLSHEQLHFDVSELFARKMRKGIQELRTKKITDRNQYEALISQTLRELNNYQDEYDKGTFHGAIDIIQYEWEKKVKIELDRLNDYASTLKDCRH